MLTSALLARWQEKKPMSAPERYDGSNDPTIALRGQDTVEPSGMVHRVGTSASDDTAKTDMNAKVHLLRDAVAPLDLYTADGVYWADLPLPQRVRGTRLLCWLSSALNLRWSVVGMGARPECRRTQARVGHRVGDVQGGPTVASDGVLEVSADSLHVSMWANLIRRKGTTPSPAWASSSRVLLCSRAATYHLSSKRA